LTRFAIGGVVWYWYGRVYKNLLRAKSKWHA